MSKHMFHAEAFLPTVHDIQLALASSQVLADLLSTSSGDAFRMQLKADGVRAAEIDLPLSIVRLLLAALEEMAAGNAVTLLPSRRR